MQEAEATSQRRRSSAGRTPPPARSGSGADGGDGDDEVNGGPGDDVVDGSSGVDDLDGGFGQEHTPAELDSAADLPQLETALTTAGFTPDEAHDILAHNLTRFFAETLPPI